MRVMVASDLHGNTHYADELKEKGVEEEVELIVLCGDLTNFGTVNLGLKILEMVAGAEIPVLFVPGNCDPKELANAKTGKGVHCIHKSSYRVRDYEFMGLGGSSATPFHTLFELGESEIETMLENAYENVGESKHLALVSHTPPKDTKLDKAQFGVAAGSLSVRKFILEKKPDAVFCGHIHESRGIDTLGSTVMVNPGPAFRGFYAVAKLENRVEIELKSL